MIKPIPITFNRISGTIELPLEFIVQMVSMSKIGCDFETDVQGGLGDSEKQRMLSEFRQELKDVWEDIRAAGILAQDFAVPWDKL